MTPTLAAAVAVGIAVLPARAAAGTLASVTPLGASPGIVVRVTGTGFAAEAARNEVLLRSGAGSEARVTPTEVTTLDAAKGLRRLAFTMPGSLPAGTASIAVTNLATGEVSAGGNIEVITIALSLSSAVRGASDLQIRVSGSPNCQFVAGRTMVTFGPGVTINGLSVESPATLVAGVTVDAAAAPGPRTVQVISSLHQAVLPGGFTVTVSPQENQPPSVVAGPGRTITLPMNEVALAAAVNDDGLPSGMLTVSWLMISGPAPVTFGNAASATTIVRFSIAGTYVLRITASDGSLSSTADLTVVVQPKPNSPPVANAGGPYAGTVREAITFDGSRSRDPDGESLTFAWSFGDGGTAAGASVQYRYTQPGTYTVTLTVTDPAGEQNAATVPAVVAGDKVPPVVTPPAGITVAAVNASGTPATNPAIAAFLAAATATDNLDGSLPARAVNQPAAFPLGVTTVTFLATDSAGNTGTATATVTVTDQTAPVVTPPAGLMLFAPNQDGLPASDHAIATFLAGATALDNVDGPLPAAATTPPTVFPIGSTPVTFSATDAAGNKGTAVANVVVSVAPATLTIALSEPPDGAVLGSSPAAVRGAVSNPNAWVHLQEKPVPVYTGLFEGSVSLSEGPNEITATGRDASGASATTSRTVILDTTPPVVTIHSPKDRALLTIAPANVTAFVEDATAVTCTLAGQPATVASGWVRGPVGLTSGENTIAVSCRDAAGNETQQSRVVFYDGSPLWVRGFAPPDGADSLSSGARITVVFSEPIRPASLTANSFFVRHGTTVLPAALVVAGDALSGTLVPEGGVPPGADLEVTVTTGVTDAAGNPLSAPVVAHYRTLGQAAVSGSVIGEVFDDVRGLPLAGADVEALAADSGATIGQATTDERGRYQLGPFPADAILVVSKTGFTSSTRLNVVASSATEVLDARLTAVEASQTIDPLLPSVVKSGGHQLRVPPGALGVPAPVSLTAVGPQGPQSPFPIGWAPLGIVEVRAPGDFGPVAQLDIADKTAAAVGRQAAIVRYDAASRSWLMVLAATVSTEGVATLPDVTSPGQYALVLPDDGTSAPPWPALGSALSGTTAQALPDTATASGHVTPAVGRADDPTPAKAVVTVLSPADLPSGTLIRGDFSELFTLFSSGSIAGVSSSQDLVVYRRPGQADGRSLTAEFAVAPSRTFSPAALKEGTITVTILRREMLSRTLVGAAGGGFRAPDGSRVVIPPGALTDPVPVDLTRVAESDFPSIAGSGWTFLGGLKLDLWSAVPSASLELTLAGAGSVAGSRRTIVVAKVVGVLGQDRLEIVAMGRVAGADATSVASWNGVTFPGVRSEGRYAFYVSPSAMTPVTGTARDAAGRREGHRVSCDGVPFVSLTDVAGAFEVICAPGAFRLRAGQAASRDEAVAEGQTGTPFPEIVIVPLPPRIEAIAVRSPKMDGNWAGPIALLAQPRPVVDDDAAGASLGDGDGLVEAGERVELSFHVRNDGTVTVEGAMLELRFRHAGGPATCARDIVTGITLVPDAPVAIGPFVCEIPASADAGTIVYTLLRRTADGKFLTQSSFTLPFDVEHHGVPIDSEIAVTFTEAVTIPADGYSLVREDGGPGTAVETKLSVGADGATATVRPLAALAGSARYRLVLGAAIVDGDGRALDGAPVTVRISTVDTTPPPPIDPAHIEASAPDADGFVTVTATAGSANPTDTVILLNNTSGAAVTAEPGSDGSFEAKVVAQPGDRLSIILRDINGNKTTIDPGPLIRRDPVTGDVTGVVLTTSGGTVPGPGGINLTVSAGSARGGVEMSVSLVAEPFALPADIVADASLASAFAAAFSPLARFDIQSSIRAFGVPLQLTMPAPVGSAVGDVFVIVRHRAVTIGGALADLEGVTGIAAADNPAHSVQRLEIVDSATVKDDLGAIVLSSDSAPLAGILEPGVYTVLRVLEPLTLVAGTVRRDTSSGLAVSGSVVSSLPAAVATAAFAAITNRQGAFVAADAALGGPQPPGAVLSSRLDAFDPRYRRIIRRDVRGEVRPPIPPGTSVVHLSEPLLLPSTLPSALIAVLGDVEPPQVAIQLEGAPLENGLVRAGDPLTIRVTVTDDDRVAFTWLEMNTGAEIQGIALASDGTGQFTPTDGLFTLVARARDSAGNEGTASTIIRAVAAPAGQPLVPTPLPGRSPEALGSAEPGGGGAGQPDARLARPAGDAAAAADAGAPSILHAVPSDGSLMFVFSEPLALSTVTEDNVKVLDPEGEEVDIDLYFGVGNSGVWVKAARHFRYGAVYTLKMSSGIRDLNGESFAGLEMKFYIPQPVQAATIELQNAEDVVLVGENLAVSKTDAEGGSVRLYQVTEAMDPLTPFAPLALLPEPKLLSTFTTRGLPWALAADGDRLYVANRFRGFWGEEAAGYYGGFFGMSLSYIWQTQMPAPVSHLSVYDVSDPSAPAFSTGAVLNFFSVNNWNPANWVRRLEITPQGLGVVNFLENIEMFTLSEPPASRGVVELHWWDPGQRPGRCNGDPTGSPCIVPSFKDHITFGSNPQLADQICSGRCVNTTEFYDAAFFDGFAVSVDQAGLRILSTAPEDMSRASGSDRSLSFYPLGTAPFGRVGSVMGYAWTDQQGVARVSDLAFVATPRDRTLRIFDVTAPSSPVLLSETLNVVGNMSFDSTAGLAYIFGFQGEFHVIDFIDPTRPLELNDPGANSELLPFSVTGLGGTSSFNGNTNRRGIVYVASWDGVAIVDTRAEPDVETACENLGPCRTNTWQPGLGCVRSAKPDGFSCEDGLFCNGAETCRAGVCSPGLTPWLDDGVGCTADRCNEQLDRRMNVPDDSVCASGDCFNGRCDKVKGCVKDTRLAGLPCGTLPPPEACTFPSACDGKGTCVPGTPYMTPNDGDACSVELPQVWSNGQCGDRWILNDSMCGDADGKTCTVPRCEPGGGCIEVPDDSKCTGILDPGDKCHSINCDPADRAADATTGCVIKDLPDGTSCENGAFCDGKETCRAGTCVKGEDWTQSEMEGATCGDILEATLAFCSGLNAVKWRVDYVTESGNEWYCGNGPTILPVSSGEDTPCISYGVQTGTDGKATCEAAGQVTIVGSAEGDASCAVIKKCPGGAASCAPIEKQVVCSAVCTACK